MTVFMSSQTCSSGTSPQNFSETISNPLLASLCLSASSSSIPYQQALRHSLPSILVFEEHPIMESLGSPLSSQGSFSLASTSSSTTTSVFLSYRSTPHATNPRSISGSTSPKCNIVSSASLTATTHKPKPPSISTTSTLLNFPPSFQEIPPPTSTQSPRIRNLQILPKRLWTRRSENQ